MTVMNEPIGVLLADDHPVVRRGLKAAIEDDARLRVIAESADGFEALRQLNELKPAVGILDIEMPGLNGLGVARELAGSPIQSRIIFMSLQRWTPLTPPQTASHAALSELFLLRLIDAYRLRKHLHRFGINWAKSGSPQES